MHAKQAKLGRFCVFVLATAFVALSLSGQQTSHTRISLVTDWSSRHLVFSTPTTPANLAEAWQDPRFRQQWLRRNVHPAPPTDGEETNGAAARSSAAEANEAASAFPGTTGGGGLGFGGGRAKASFKRDWSTSLGPGATIGAGTYPAKFSFDTATASCANDFVAMGTSVAGAPAGATATATGTFSSTGPDDGDTVTLTYGSGSVATVTASAAEAASVTGTFSANPSTAQTATIGTLVLHSVPGGQITFTGEPAAGDTVTVGATTYTFQTTCSSGPACVVRSSTTTTNGLNLAIAIANTCQGSHSDCDVTSGANTSVTGANAAGVVTLTSKASPPPAYTLSENAGSTTVATGARGIGSNTGTNFVIGVTNATSVTDNDAASLAAAIAGNSGTAGATATSTGSMVTVTATTAGTGGNGKASTETLTGFTWAATTLTGGAAPQSGDNFFAITNATGTSLTLTQIASGFATAVAAESGDVGVPVTTSPSGAVVTVTASVPGSLGLGVTLADSMTNFGWNHTALAGGVGQASIVAYNNLYSSCTAPVPTTFWSYFTGGTVQTSPVLSLDGKQLAFVQSSGSNVASLVLLKWASASVTAGSPVSLSTSTASAYPACVAPCMLTLTFSATPNDTNSAPYYDYSSDVLYVGDDNGTLHKFTPVFGGGTPAEIVTSPWPIALANSTGMQTSSPVFAINNGIYIASARTNNGSTTGGYLYRVNPATGAVTASTQIADRPGIVDAPIVDPFAGEVYVFAGNDTGNCSFGIDCTGVFQFGTAFASATAGTEAKVGTGTVFGTPRPMFTGDFDNTYFNSSDPPTGNLYACGNTGGSPTLYRIHIAANVMAAPVTGPTLTSGTTTCSPITEAFNGTADLIFVNVQDNGNLGSCGGGGCVMSFTVTSGTLPGTPTSSLPENGGTSGFIIDTLGIATGGANQVYFSPLATGAVCPTGAGCAIQASQSGLN